MMAFYLTFCQTVFILFLNLQCNIMYTTLLHYTKIMLIQHDIVYESSAVQDNESKKFR